MCLEGAGITAFILAGKQKNYPGKIAFANAAIAGVMCGMKIKIYST
jgi:hypothetical protein